MLASNFIKIRDSLTVPSRYEILLSCLTLQNNSLITRNKIILFYNKYGKNLG